ncbi:hypothetical protein D3C77_474470 [compost metagenome]
MRSPFPLNPAFVMLTYVSLSPYGVNIHSTELISGGDQLINMRRFASNSRTSTSVPTPYISHSQWIRLPASNLPLLLVNQNFVVIEGSTKASNTSCTGLRISIPVWTIGSWFTLIIVLPPSAACSYP